MGATKKLPKIIQPKRTMGLPSTTNFMVSSMLGAGIFVTPGNSLSYVGSVGMALVVWTVCGIVSFLGALVYAELGTVVPRSGSDYAFFMEAFGPLHKYFGPLPGFLYSFVFVFGLKPVAAGTLVMISTSYITRLISDLICMEDSEYYISVIGKLIAVLEICFMTFINVFSVKAYVRIVNVTTYLKLILCVFIIATGLNELSMGNVENISKGFEGTNVQPKNLALGFVFGFLAYGGWSNLPLVTEEIKKPEVNILRSILCSVPLITVVYVLMNVSYMTVLTNDEMTSSSTVALDFGNKTLGRAATIVISLGVAVSSFCTAMITQFGIARLSYTAGQEGHMLKVLSFIHVRRLTPGVGVVLQGALSILVVSVSDLAGLMEFMQFIFWLGCGANMITVFILRRTKKDAPRPFVVPSIIPVLILLVSLFLVLVPIITSPTVEYFIAVGLLVFGTILYTILVYKDIQPSCMSRFNHYVQILFEVVPKEDAETLPIVPVSTHENDFNYEKAKEKGKDK